MKTQKRKDANTSNEKHSEEIVLKSSLSKRELDKAIMSLDLEVNLTKELKRLTKCFEEHKQLFSNKELTLRPYNEKTDKKTLFDMLSNDKDFLQIIKINHC